MAAPVKRNDAMLAALPVGVMVFAGTGIQTNLADKAKKLGLALWKFGDDQSAHYLVWPGDHLFYFSLCSAVTAPSIFLTLENLCQFLRPGVIYLTFNVQNPRDYRALPTQRVVKRCFGSRMKAITAAPIRGGKRWRLCNPD